MSGVGVGSCGGSGSGACGGAAASSSSSSSSSPGGGLSMFRWLEVLEKEFDKAFVDVDLLLGEIDPDQADITYEGRQKMTSLSSCFAQLCHKAQTVSQINHKLEVNSFLLFPGCSIGSLGGGCAMWDKLGALRLFSSLETFCFQTFKIGINSTSCCIGQLSG